MEKTFYSVRMIVPHAVKLPPHDVVVLHGVDVAGVALTSHERLEVPVHLFVDFLNCPRPNRGGAHGFKVWHEGCVSTAPC